MRLIDSVIRSSLSEAVKKSGGLLAFSRRIGVAHSTVLFWLTGKTKRINSDLWRGRVYPEIELYLKSRFPDMELMRIREKYSDCMDGISVERRMIPVPLLREHDMLSYDPVMESICVFAEKFAAEKAWFVCDCRKKYFSVELGSADAIAFGSACVELLCAAEERVKDGDFAVLRMRGSESLLLRRVFLENECVHLEPFRDGGKKVVWNYRVERGRVEWMFPALWVKAVCPRGGAGEKNQKKIQSGLTIRGNSVN